MDTLCDDVLLYLMYKCDCKSLSSLSRTNNHFNKLLINNKIELLKPLLSFETELILDEFTIHQLNILYKKHISKRTKQLESKDFKIENITFNNVIRHIMLCSTIIVLLDNKTIEIFDLITKKCITNNFKNVKDVIYGNNRCLIHLESNEVWTFNGSLNYLIDNIKQITYIPNCTYFLTTNGKIKYMLYDEKIKDTNIDNVIKVGTLQYNLIYLKSDGITYFKNIVWCNNIIDIIVCENYCYYLDRNDQIYISGNISKEMYIKYIGNTNDNSLHFYINSLSIVINNADDIRKIFIN